MASAVLSLDVAPIAIVCGMKALFVVGKNPVAAAAMRGWLDAGNAIAAVWLADVGIAGSGRHDVRLGYIAPRWSVSAIARQHSIPIRRVSRLSAWRDSLDAVKNTGADVLVSAYFPFIVPREILDHFSDKAVNLHPAPLPRYRGPTPIGAMVRDHKLHVDGTMSLHIMTARFDEGPIIAQTPIVFPSRRSSNAFGAASGRSAYFLTGTVLSDYLSGAIAPQLQDSSMATYERTTIGELEISSRLTLEEVAIRCMFFGHSGHLGVSGIDRARIFEIARNLGAPTGSPPIVRRHSIEMDLADARVRLQRNSWLLRKFHRVASLFELINEPG
jgi:methionyl-tRNA formyltransferase